MSHEDKQRASAVKLEFHKSTQKGQAEQRI